MIQHVALPVPAELLPDCIAFYALLGFEQTASPPSLVNRAVWLAQPGEPARLHLLATASARPQAGHVALVAAPYGSVLEQLRGAGHAVRHRRPHWGSARCYVADPAGNVIELMEHAP